VLNGIARHLEPIIAHRLEQEILYSADWPDKPVRDSTFLSFFANTYFSLQNDLITWLLDAAKASGEERTPHNMAKRMVVFSFASTYSSAVVCVFVYYLLCCYPHRRHFLRHLPRFSTSYRNDLSISNHFETRFDPS